jgi:hypothetical protein
MKRKIPLNSAATMTILLMLVLSISLIPVAVAVSATPSGVADQCMQITRGMLYSRISNSKYICKIDGNRLLINDFGRMAPAPEGVYKKLGDGKECTIGKGGIVLSCNR